jgi:type I thyroxine 5'-deiodinase
VRLETIHQRYRDEVEFRLVYVREAHAADEWAMAINVAEAIEHTQPTRLDERVEIAATCAVALPLTMTTLVDDMDDAVGAAYAALPERLWLIDAEGTVAYRGGPGPWEFDPDAWESAIVALLAARRSATTSAR